MASSLPSCAGRRSDGGRLYYALKDLGGCDSQTIASPLTLWVAGPPRVSVSEESLGLFSVGRSAWDALDYIPIVLLIAIVAVLAVLALRLTNAIYKPPARANAVVAILGAVSVLLILFRIVDPPNFGSIGAAFGSITIEGTVQFPIFLALLAAAGIAFGGCWAMREERGAGA